MYNTQTIFPGANIGGGGAQQSPGVITGLLIQPAGTIYTQTQQATLKASIQANLINDVISSRSFIVGQIGRFKDNSEKVKFDSVDVYKTPTSEGAYSFQYDLLRDGKETHEQLRKFNGQWSLYEVIFIDDKYNLIGVKSPNATTGLPELAGFPLHNIYTWPFEQGEINKIPKYCIQVDLMSVKDLSDNCYIINAGFNPMSKLNLKGVIDAIGTPGQGDATGMTTTITTNNGLSNLTDAQYAALIAVGAFTCTKDSTGASVTITSITKVGKTLVFVLGTGATTGDKVTIGLKAISVTSGSPYNFMYISMETAGQIHGTY